MLNHSTPPPTRRGADVQGQPSRSLFSNVRPRRVRGTVTTHIATCQSVVGGATYFSFVLGIIPLRAQDEELWNAAKTDNADDVKRLLTTGARPDGHKVGAW